MERSRSKPCYAVWTRGLTASCRGLLLLVPLLFLALSARAGTPAASHDPLKALVDDALKNNPGIQAQRARISASEQAPAQARSLPDPTADLEFMDLSVNHFSASDALTKSVSVGVSQPLPFPGKRKLAAQEAERRTDRERESLRVMESDLRARVISSAYAWVLYRRLLSLNAQTQSALQAAAHSAAAVYSTGGGNQSDVLLAQTALTKAEADRKDLALQEAIAKAQIEKLLGGPVAPSQLEQIPLPPPAPLPPLEALLAELPQAAPRVRAARAEESVTQARVAVARRAFKPDFMVGARYRHNDMTMGGGDYVTATVGITLPFFHRKDRYQPALQQALFDQQSAGYAAREALTGARYDLTQAYDQGTRDASVFALYQEGLLLQARQAYESALAAYTVGKADFTTLLAALTNLYAYQGEAFTAQAGYQQAKSSLEATLGHPLTAATAVSPSEPHSSEEREP